MEHLEGLQAVIGAKFKDSALLRQAITHRSYLNEHRGENLRHNERLEFLGDAVLEIVVTEFLYSEYPDKEEGELTGVRAALVNTQSISNAATKLGLDDYLLMSRGERKDTGKARTIILANAFEAIIGAIYLDQGHEAAQRFIATALFHKTEEIVAKRLWMDAKSRLQELIQEDLSITPIYQMLERTGPDHDARFRMGVYFDSQFIATGVGASKQEAEQAAAQAALDQAGVAEVLEEVVGPPTPPAVEALPEPERLGDAMSILLARSQEVLGAEPEYRVIEETGPAHSRSYVFGVYIRRRLIAKGSGGNERDASMRAAEAALMVRGWK